MTKPKELEKGDRARSYHLIVEVLDVDKDCTVPFYKVRYPNGSIWWEPRRILRKLPDRKEE